MDIKTILEKLNASLTDAKIAELVGDCSQSTINRARHGKRDVKSRVADKIRQIARAHKIIT